MRTMEDAETDALMSLLQYIRMSHAARAIQRFVRNANWVEVERDSVSSSHPTPSSPIVTCRSSSTV